MVFVALFCCQINQLSDCVSWQSAHKIRLCKSKSDLYTKYSRLNKKKLMSSHNLYSHTNTRAQQAQTSTNTGVYFGVRSTELQCFKCQMVAIVYMQFYTQTLTRAHVYTQRDRLDASIKQSCHHSALDFIEALAFMHTALPTQWRWKRRVKSGHSTSNDF